MSGIVNSTGAVSGVIGTTVGTPVTDLSTATFPDGHVLQCKSFSTYGTGMITHSSGNRQLLYNPNIVMTICPLNTGSHVLIQAQWMGDDEYPESVVVNVLREEGTVTATSARVNAPGTNVWEGLTVVSIGYAPYNFGSTPKNFSIMTLDKTGTTEGTDVQYALARSTQNNDRCWTNRCHGAVPQGNYEHCSSSIVLTEIMQ